MYLQSSEDCERLNSNESQNYLDYVQAIERIGVQFNEWEKKQQEFKTYHSQYEKAGSLLRSIGFGFPRVSILDIENSETLPTTYETQLILDEGQPLISTLESSRKNKLEKKAVLESSIQRLLAQLNTTEISLQKASSSLHRIDEYRQDELKENYSNILANQRGTSISRIFFFLLFVVLPCVWFRLDTITIFILIVTNLALIIILRLFSSDKLLSSLHDILFDSTKLQKIRRDILDSRKNQEHSLAKKVKDELEEIKSLNAQVSQLKDKLQQNIQDLEVASSQHKLNVFNHLKCFEIYILLAHQAASKSAPRDFSALSITQQASLEKLLNQWNASSSAGQPSRLLAESWQEDIWQSQYQPQTSGQAPGYLRVGQLFLENIDPTSNKATAPIEIPAMLPIRAISTPSGMSFPGHIVIMSNAQDRPVAIKAMEALALRLLTTFPVRKLKASLIDPVAMGDTFPFKSFPKSILSGQQIFTRTQDIQEELKTLVNHIEQVIQNYLGRTYATLEDYNAASQSIEEAYRYLCIADFPTAFDQRTGDELKSLITNGSRAGVYSIIHVDLSQEPLRGFDYSLFDQYCTVIRPTDDQATAFYNGQPVFQLQLFEGSWKRSMTLDQPPNSTVYQHIIQAITAAEKSVKVETIPFTGLYPTQLWAANSQQELRAPIGMTGAREHIEFWVGENDEQVTVSSGLLAGKPGAGKSYTLHSTILSLAMQYSPDELELYLLDFKEGVEFQIYVDPDRAETVNQTKELDETYALPHAKVISIESDREFGLSVLQAIQGEIELRGQRFKDAGVSELRDYRQKTGQQIARVLVVIDEFQYMFQENDAITRELNQIYEDIARRGRSFGVHLLLASQSLNIANINSRIYSYMPLRMAMQMDQTTAAIVLAEGNTDSIELLDRSGRIIYNTEFGRKSQNQLGQIADVSLAQRRDAMHRIRKQAEASEYKRAQPLIVFQGNRASKISQNGQFIKLSQLPDWLPSSALNKQIIQNPDWLSQEAPGVAWLGEAMRIGRHSQAIFRRRARSNMLLIGQSESSIFGMLGGALVSLLYSYRPTDAEFHIIDLAQNEDEESLSEMTANFQQAFQDLHSIKLGQRFPDSERGIKRAESILANLHEEFQTRKQILAADPDATKFGPSIFFIAMIGGLNRAQNLRPIDGKRGDEMSPDAQKLQEIATAGPELGIHTILWFDNAKTLQKLSGDGSHRTLLTQFDYRITMQLPAEDSRLILGEPIAQNLPALRAYFYDAALSDGFEKFKPYTIPTKTEITHYAQNLKQRSLHKPQ